MNDPYYDGGGAFLAALLVTYLILFIVLIALYVISAIFYNRLFAKAGVEGKWRGWVPIYREMVFVKLGDLSPWPLLIGYGVAIILGWVPVLGWLIGLATNLYLTFGAYRVGKKLQKEGAWAVLFFFLSIVWLGINAYDKSRWNPVIEPKQQWASNGFFDDKTVWRGIPVQPAAVAGPAVPPPGAYPPPPPAGYAPPPPAGYTPPPPPPSTQPPSADEPPRV